MPTHTAYDICCIGHITKDKVVTPKNTVCMFGGTAYYFSNAIGHFNDVNYFLLTALGNSEQKAIEDLNEKGINVSVMPSKHTVYFENIYGENQNNRIQHVLSKADPFKLEYLRDLDAKIFHLGALLADDFSLDLIRFLSGKGLVSADSQGFLREVRGTDVFPVDWADKKEALQYIHFLKANEHEMEALTGTSDIIRAAKKLYEWGVQEVLLTLGSEGSVIYDGKSLYKIPAYQTGAATDATGCGDTYMTGYLYQRFKGKDIYEAGCFGAAMATLKIQHSGAFDSTVNDITNCINTYKQILPNF